MVNQINADSGIRRRSQTFRDLVFNRSSDREPVEEKWASTGHYLGVAFLRRTALSFTREQVCVANSVKQVFAKRNLRQSRQTAFGATTGELAMLNVKRLLPFALILSATLGGCGLYVPEKDILNGDTPDSIGISPSGKFENDIVKHIRCEIFKGLWDANHQLPRVQPWLPNWGTSVTLTLTVDEQSLLNPGVSVFNPFENVVKTFPVGGNVTGSQFFSLGIGASATAHATRQETIQVTYSNKDLLIMADKDRRSHNGALSCEGLQNGVMIEGDLKIGQFIYDKSVIASFGNGTTQNPSWPPYDTFSEQITFVALFGGTVTPTWKFFRTSVNETSTLLTANRTNTDNLTITLGALQQQATAKAPALLGPAGQNIHNASVFGAATAQSINAQTH
jgi:hypothetical protein